MKNVSPNMNISDLEKVGLFSKRTYEARTHRVDSGIVTESAKIKLTDLYYGRKKEHTGFFSLEKVEITCNNSADSLTVTPDKEINVEFVTLDFCGISVRLTAGQAIDLKDELKKVNL